jgi:hypothetical protein
LDRYNFLAELNNYLDFKFAGLGKVSGERNGIYSEIFFADDDRLMVRTSVRLFGDLPYKDHIEGVFRKLSSFHSYSLNEDEIELLSVEITDVDSAFNVSQDVILFFKEMADLGYKDSTPARDINERLEEARQAQHEMLGVTSVHPDDETERALPSRIGFGILGAVIGAAVSMGIWIVLSMLNYMFPFIFGAIVVVMAPLVLYELFSGQKTSAIQIGICLFLSVVALLLGDRIIWSLNLLDWYHDIDFAMAYWEVPYLVEDGIVEAFDYYRDYIVMFAPVLLFYFIVIRNYLTGGMTVRELMAKRTR